MGNLNLVTQGADWEAQPSPLTRSLPHRPGHPGPCPGLGQAGTWGQTDWWGGKSRLSELYTHPSPAFRPSIYETGTGQCPSHRAPSRQQDTWLGLQLWRWVHVRTSQAAVWMGLAAAVPCTQHTLTCLLSSWRPGNLATGSVPPSWVTSGKSLPKDSVLRHLLHGEGSEAWPEGRMLGRAPGGPRLEETAGCRALPTGS